MKKIAIFRRNGLGDLLTTYPLITYLKKENPESVITLFVEETNYPLLKFLPRVDEVVVLPTKGNKYLTLIKEVYKRRRYSYDMAISAKTSPMKLMNLTLFALGAKERYAYTNDHWHSRFVNRALFYNEERARQLHQALKCLHLVAPHLTEVPEELYPKIEVPSALCQPYLEHFHCKEPTIFISATTTKSENRFDSVRYAKVLNHLYEKSAFRVCLVSMEKDEIRAKLIARHLHMPYKLHFTHAFDEFVALLFLSDFAFIGDGGVAHIAAAMNKPQVVLFGQSDPKNWHPLSHATTALYHPLHVNALQDQNICETLYRMTI